MLSGCIPLAKHSNRCKPHAKKLFGLFVCVCVGWGEEEEWSCEKPAESLPIDRNCSRRVGSNPDSVQIVRLMYWSMQTPLVTVRRDSGNRQMCCMCHLLIGAYANSTHTVRRSRGPWARKGRWCLVLKHIAPKHNTRC